MRDPETTTSDRTGRILAIVLALVLFFLLATPVFSDGIRLHDQAATKSDEVLLKDVAELEGEAEPLGEIVVAAFTKDEAVLTVTLDSVQGALRDSGRTINWAFMELKGYRSCDVRRLETQATPVIEKTDIVIANHREEVTTETAITIGARVEEAIAKMIDFEYSEMQVSFDERHQQVASMEAHAGRWEVQLISRSTLGKVPMVVRQYDDTHEIIAEHRLFAMVSVRAAVVYATHKIDRNQIVRPSDVEIRDEFIETSRVSPVTALEQVVGKVARRTVEPNAVVSQDDFELPMVIRRGDKVSVHTIVGSLVVRTVMIASTDGSRGEVIKLRKPDSRSTVFARVSSAGKAVIVQDDELVALDDNYDADQDAVAKTWQRPERD